MRRTRFVEKNYLQRAVGRGSMVAAVAVCALCGSELDVEPESGEARCPVCEVDHT